MLCTAVYEHLTPKMAMKLGSKYKFTEVQARHWEQFAQAAGLSPAQVKKRVLALARQLPAEAAALRSAFVAQDTDHPILDEVVGLIERRCQLTRKRLDQPGPGGDE